MSDKKHIDRVFQERFRDFEAAPPPEVWQRLADKQKGRTETSSTTLYQQYQYRIASVAAAVIVLLGMGWFWFGPNTLRFSEPSSTPIVHTEDSDLLPDGSEGPITSSDSLVSPNSVLRDSSVSRISNPGNSPVTEQIKRTEMVATETRNTVAREEKRTYTKTQSLSNISTTPSSVSRTDSQVTPSKNRIDEQFSAKSSMISVGSKTEARTDSNASGAVHGTEKAYTAGLTNPESSSNPGYKSSFEKSDSGGALSTQSSIASRTLRSTQVRKSISGTEDRSSATKEKNVITKPTDTLTKELLPPPIERSGDVLLDERWSIASHVAPIYYNSLENGSPIDPSLIDNTSRTETTLSYGVQIAYQVTDKVRIRSGVNTVQLNQITNDITVSPALQSRFFPNLDIRPGAIDTPLEIGDAAETETAFRTTVANSDLSEAQSSEFIEPARGSLEQQLRFIEIPTEVAVVVLDKKIGMHLIGGMSTLILDKNEVSLTSPTVSGTIGTTDNLNPVSFSGNVGVGLDYKFTKKFLLTLEPIVKYQFNTYSGNTGDFQPYFFGVYTGLSYRF